MKTVIFLTSAYPYLPGEQFIEDEICHWAMQTSAQVVLVPMTAVGKPRNTPARIEVDLSLAQSRSLPGKLKNLIKAAFSKIFWKEVAFIYASHGVTLGCYARALRAVSDVLRIDQALTKISLRRGAMNVAYCYWNAEQAYAAVRIKKRGLLGRVISRAHGGDLYQERRVHQYMPLKRQFIGDMDLILAIADQGKRYLQNTYGVSPTKIMVSRLGVPVPALSASVSGQGRLHIVSVSFCVAVKRIDKIIDAIADAATALKGIHLYWTHIGGGELFSVLSRRAAEKLTPLQVQFDFLGNQEHAAVRGHFEQNFVDVFVNASESEGLPVSIMEAMSYGVPVIAPNVGGIAELVSNDCGRLLSDAPSVADIAAAIIDMSLRCKFADMRIVARQRIATHYSATSNYCALVNSVVGAPTHK
jgi:colanic acid/amylovoran biosynthesis glycosyltransferase